MLWVLVLVAVGPIGAIIYFVMARQSRHQPGHDQRRSARGSGNVAGRGRRRVPCNQIPLPEGDWQ
jgi:hypothetical protein